MTTFGHTMDENTATLGKNCRVLAMAATAVTAAGRMLTKGSSMRTGRGFTTNGSTGGGTSMRTATSATEKEAGDGLEDYVPGPGGALSPETAKTCLQLLADAKEAYEGQGFALQADGAARFGRYFSASWRTGGTLSKPNL